MPAINIKHQTRPNSSQAPADLPPPQRYKVVLLNDYYTPMDFVVSVLTEIFLLPQPLKETKISKLTTVQIILFINPPNI